MFNIIKNKFYVTSVVIAVISLIGFGFHMSNANVISLLLFLIVPMVLHIFTSALHARSVKTISPIKITLAYSLINILSTALIGILCTVTGSISQIFQRSTQFASEYVSISTDNSPLVSSLIVIALFFALYYFITKTFTKPQLIEEG